MNRIALFIVTALLTVQGFSQYRDTVVVDNAVFQRLSEAATDSFLTINRAGVVSYVYMPPTTYKDSIYWQPGGVTSAPQWIKAGDTIFIDTTATAVIDTFIVKILRVDSLYVTTVTIDTIHMGTDTIYSIGQLRDSIYYLPASVWGAAGWYTHGDTLIVDTTGGGEGYWQRTGGRLTPATEMDSVYTAYGGLAAVNVYGSNAVSNGGFETYTGHSGGLAQFTDWFNGTTVSGYIDTAAGYIGAYSVKLSDGGSQTANIFQESRSFVATTRYKLTFYHKGAAMVYQLYRGTTYFNASTGAWGSLTANAIPAAADWTLYEVDFTAPTTASNYTIKIDQQTNGSTTYIDAVQIATYAEHMAITTTYPLHTSASKYIVRGLTNVVGDTAVIIRNDSLFKGKVSVTIPTDSIYINGAWYFSGDSVLIAIDYDSINVDSLITGALIDSIITTVNIDSILNVELTVYMDTATAVRDTINVQMAEQWGVSGWYGMNDTLWLDTTKAEIYVSYCDGCAPVSGWRGNADTIEIDTSRAVITSTIVTSDTIVTLILTSDTIYIGTDTLTAGDYIWRKGNSGTNNAMLRSGGNYISGNHAIVIGFLDTVTGTGAFATGWWAKATATASVAMGYAVEAGEIGAYAGGSGNYSGGVLTRVKATGVASFNHSYIDVGGKTSVASGIASAVLGGMGSSATGTGTVVLGMDGKTGTAAYTTYVNDLRADGEIYLSDSTYIDEVGGWMYSNSQGYLWQADTSYLALTSRVLRPYTVDSRISLGDSAVPFIDGWYAGKLATDEIRIADNAAAGRVLIADNSLGDARWGTVSELTGTADTFYLPGEGWLQSGDTITLPVVDSSKWSRSTGRLVSKHVGDTVGVGDKGHLVPYGAAGEVLIDFEDFVGYTDTIDDTPPSNITAAFSSLIALDDRYQYGAGSDYDIDTSNGSTGVAIKLTNSGLSTWFFIELNYADEYENYESYASFKYKGDGLTIAVIGPYGYSYDFSDSTWANCDGFNWITTELGATSNWTEIKIHYPILSACVDSMGNFFQVIFTPPDSIGASVSIDDIRVSYVDSGMNIVSEGSLHITPSDNFYVHNLPFATTDTLLGLDGDRVVKTAITLPVVDSSKWSLSSTSLTPKSTSYNVGIGNTSPAYKLDVTGAAYFSNRIYYGSTTGHIQGDGSGGVYVTGPTSGALTIAPGANPLYSFQETAVTLYSHNTIDLGATSSRFKNIYAGTKIFTPKLQLSSLSTNTTSTDVLVLNGSEVEKRTGFGMWYAGTSADSYRSTNIASVTANNYSVSIGAYGVASDYLSIAHGTLINASGQYNSIFSSAYSKTSGTGSSILSSLYDTIYATAYNSTKYSSSISNYDCITSNSAEYSSIIASRSASMTHKNSAIIASYYGASVADYTLHTDNLHVYETATIGEVLTLTSIADLPTSPASGMLVNHAGVLKLYNGSTWKTISFD